ncbi:MAG: AMP-binding protein [Candidatus Nanopelagicales bacterium]
MNPLADLLLAATAVDPDRLAVRAPDGVDWTYAELEAHSAAAAAMLVERGVRPGDRVVVATAKSAAALAVILGCTRVGAVLVPLSPAFPDAELARLVTDADPAALVVDAGRHVDALDLAPGVTTIPLSPRSPTRPGGSLATPVDAPRVPADPAAVVYTSGTTGAPKGAVLSHGALVASATTLASAWGMTADDVLLHVLPLDHVHGLFVAAQTILAVGGTLLLEPRFDVDRAVALLPGATVLMGVPTHYARLLLHPGFDRASAGSLRLLTSGSAPMSAALHRAVEERTGLQVLERYGMTETCILTSNPLHGERRPGSVGQPLPGVSVRVVDGEGAESAPGAVGHVQVRTPCAFDGYWRRPELTRDWLSTDGWIRTGDLGRVDADGYLTLVGREKDLVITGGLNVYPADVERVLDAQPEVAESAVVGLPDDDLGERLVAVVVPAPGHVVDPDDLVARLRADLAGYQVPRDVRVVAALPRNAMGKVQKQRLRADPPPPR